MPRCLVALGSNLGDRASLIARSVHMLRAQAADDAPRLSPLHETSPLGGAAGQAPYLNAAVSFDTSLTAEQLHATMRHIEDALGRKRGQRWAARTIDLDLLLYGTAVIDTASLVVPHPRMAFRRFVLEPAAEVAPEMIHPAIGWSVARLLAHLNTAKSYVALLGLPGRGKTALAQRLLAACDARLLAGPMVEAAEPQAAAPAAGTAGPAYRREIELLERRAQLLDRRHWPETDVLAISDFYFDQSLAYVELTLGDSQRAAYRDAFQLARAQVVLPKLLVVLDTPRSAGGPVVGLADAAAGKLREKLLDLAARRDVGPVAYASGTDADAQFAEISAALEAMR